MVKSVVGQICMFEGVEIFSLGKTFKSGGGKRAQELEELDKERTTTILGLRSKVPDLVSRDRSNFGIGINKNDHTMIGLNVGLQNRNKIIPPHLHLVKGESTVRRMHRQKVYFAKWILNANEKKPRIFSTENNVFVVVKIRARNPILGIANRPGPVEPNGTPKILALGGGGVDKKVGAVLDPILDARFLKTCNIYGK